MMNVIVVGVIRNIYLRILILIVDVFITLLLGKL